MGDWIECLLDMKRGRGEEKSAERNCNTYIVDVVLACESGVCVGGDNLALATSFWLLAGGGVAILCWFRRNELLINLSTSLSASGRQYMRQSAS